MKQDRSINYFTLPGFKSHVRMRFGIRSDINDALIIMSRELCVSIENLKSRQRHDRVSIARQICMYIMIQKMGMSSIQIGKIFNRDHTTVLYAKKQIDVSRLINYDIRQIIEDIEIKIQVENQLTRTL